MDKFENLYSQSQDLGQTTTSSIGSFVESVVLRRWPGPGILDRNRYTIFKIYGKQEGKIIVLLVTDVSDREDSVISVFDKLFEGIRNRWPKEIQQGFSSITEEIQSSIRTLIHYLDLERMAIPPAAEATISTAQLKKVKIVIAGLSKAGKTAIFKKFFERASTQELEGLKPTHYKDIHRTTIPGKFAKVAVHDLGGQEIFLDRHLEDMDTFKDASGIIMVIDVQDLELLDRLLLLFKRLLKQLKLASVECPITVFLHKFDPGERTRLSKNVQTIFKELDEIIQEQEISFAFTTIYDDSIDEAMMGFLFYALPWQVIESSIGRDILLQVYSKEVLGIKALFQTEEDRIAASRDLREKVIPLGASLARHLLNRWIKFLKTGEELIPQSDDYRYVQLIEMPHGIAIDLKCPVPQDLQDPILCDITHGVLEGVTRAVGLGPLRVLYTEIRDNSFSCRFVTRGVTEETTIIHVDSSPGE